MKGSEKFLLFVAALLFVVLVIFSPWAAVGCVIGSAIAAGLIVLAQRVFD